MAPGGSRVLRGVAVVPGVGQGPAIFPAPRPRLPGRAATEPGPPGEGELVEEPVVESERDAELARFTEAAGVVAARLSARSEQAAGQAAQVLSATAAMAGDRGLAGLVEERVRSGSGAATATTAAVDQLRGMFESAGGVMRERVTDLLDVRDRLVAELTGQPEPGLPMPDEPSVLLAEDLAPADTAGLDPKRVVGIAIERGGPTSHTAIIARQLDIPCVVAAPGVADVPAGTDVLVDGLNGEVVTEPDPAAAERLHAQVAAERAAVAAWTGPGVTSDGHRVEVLANVQDAAGARQAARTPAEGVGLFRTELCFLDRADEPSVEEQVGTYLGVLEAFAGAKVVVRTLDAGSDKPLAFAGPSDEPNPALGVRGLRIGMAEPGLLDRQLDAIATAKERLADRAGPIWVMAPMVATEHEAAWFAERVSRRGLVAGAMVEIPAAALHADRLLRHLDFVSLGTNDLAQYAMAADRMAPTLAELTDPWQPALLSLVEATAAAGRAAGKPVGVCGEAAADPWLGCVLVGLGVTSLSAAAGAVAAVGARLSQVTEEQCREAARAALGAADPVAARAAARDVLS